MRTRYNRLAAAVLVAGLCLLVGAAAEARTSLDLQSGNIMRVNAQALSAPSSANPMDDRPGKTGIYYEIYQNHDGFVVEEGWIPGTNDAVQDAFPTIGYEPWTGQVIAVWSRGVGEETDLYLSRYSSGQWTWPRPVMNDVGENLNPILAVDDLARVHLVWWERYEDSTRIYYQRFLVWAGLPLRHPPTILDLEVAGSPRFPYIAYQHATELVYLAVTRGEDQIDLFRFTVAGVEEPWGGGSIVIPVQVERPGGMPAAVSLQPMMIFTGEQEVPTIFWVEDGTLRFFTVLEDGRVSEIYSHQLPVEYEEAALETLVRTLVEARIEDPTGRTRPVRGPYDTQLRLR